MSDPTPDRAEQAMADSIDDAVPARGFDMTPLVGLGGSAGAIPALQKFFENVEPDCGLSFVVVLHLAPQVESELAGILQRCTRMPVKQVSGRAKVQPNHVYVIPPGKAIGAQEGTLQVDDQALSVRGRHVAVDLFLRTLADTHGPHAAAVVLSGADGDGAIGIKRVKERGGLTIAQDPQEAEHNGMPRAAIATGMVDWVLPVAEIPARLAKYFALEKRLSLPPELPIGDNPPTGDEPQLREVLAFLRARTGHDFTSYKRATILRRIGRRMQVNTVETLGAYLGCLRTTPGEAGALMQDLLISVTNFFRDADCFAALEAHLEAIFAGKGPNDSVRVWTAACATGEEAYSMAMALADRARAMEAPPLVQVFATDLDAEALRTAREGFYPAAIEADVPEERLRRYFVKEHAGYRVRHELREMVLFAQHNLLKDSPFSRLDLVSCRNLLIYLGRDAQQRVFQTFHFALRPGGLMFLGASETAEDVPSLFGVIDKQSRIFIQRPVPRATLPMPAGPATLTMAIHSRADAAAAALREADQAAAPPQGSRPAERRVGSWSEMHFKLLEAISAPSILVDAEHEILHVSSGAGRFLQFSGGEPSRNLLRTVMPALRIELRAALYQAAQTNAAASVVVSPVEISGEPREVALRVTPAKDVGADLFLVVIETSTPDAIPEQPLRSGDDPVARQLDRELERLKAHLRDTVEQYEASTEELKASNEELQAMNEELRSATEELETSREELQSINEELTTVNQELKAKVDELGHSNSDMQNLMDSTAIATVFLDRDLCVTRYTPSAVALFNLIATDLGRPLSDLATRLDYRELGDDAMRVLERLVPVEREVGLPDGKWFLARLLPYRTIEDRIAGVVVSFIDITERKRAEELRLWLSAAVKASTDAIISFAADGTVLSWNAGAERIFGLEADKAIGRSLDILAPEREEDFTKLLAQVRAGEPIANRELRFRLKEGTTADVALSASPIKDAAGKVIGGTAIARDVSSTRIAAEALRASEERLRLMIENATEYAIFSMDRERRVTLWNSGAQRLLGYTGKEVTGRSADIIFTEEDRAAGAPDEEARTALREGRAEDDRMHRRKDGSRFWASGVMMVMLDSAGETIGFVKILRDQTAARASREALEQSRSELIQVLAENEKARAELQLADSAKDRFLAVLSHELRNPLASIDGAASLLQAREASPADHQAAADIVKRQAGAMKTLLDDLLDVSRLKLGRLELRPEPVGVRGIVASAVEAVHPLLAASGHELALDMPRGKSEIELDADPLRLGQVVSNLLTNAIRYSPPGGHIVLKVRHDHGKATITVTDNGVGIDPSQIDSIFEMFTQGEDVADRNIGLGIGLALVKNIVELHGGSVHAASQGPGKGSEFRVELPGARLVAAPAAEAALPPASPAAKRGFVLVADDNVDAGWGVSKLLEIAGYESVHVRSGQEALDAMAAHKPQAAVLDIGMPDIDGHEVARRTRAAPWGRNMVLIAATGWGQEADERAAKAAGFDAHMTKPVDMRKMTALLDELMAIRRG